MNNFTITSLKKFVTENQTYEPTGIEFLDAKHEWYKNLVGHDVPYYPLFFKLAKKLKPNFVVELGSFRGHAAANWAMGNPDSTVITIDTHNDPGQDKEQAEVIEAVRKLPNLNYINDWTWEAAPEVASYKKTIDVLYIDAWHREDLVIKEWETYSPLLSNKALVICDDLFNAGGEFERMEEWFADFKYPKFINDAVHTGIPMGFMLYTRKSKKQF